MSEKIDFSRDLYEFTASIPGNAISSFSFEESEVSVYTDVDVNYCSVNVEVEIATDDLCDYALDSVDVRLTVAKLVKLLADAYEENFLDYSDHKSEDAQKEPTPFVEAVAELLRKEIEKNES